MARGLRASVTSSRLDVILDRRRGDLSARRTSEWDRSDFVEKASTTKVHFASIKIHPNVANFIYIPLDHRTRTDKEDSKQLYTTSIVGVSPGKT